MNEGVRSRFNGLSVRTRERAVLVNAFAHILLHIGNYAADLALVVGLGRCLVLAPLLPCSLAGQGALVVLWRALQNASYVTSRTFKWNTVASEETAVVDFLTHRDHTLYLFPQFVVVLLVGGKREIVVTLDGPCVYVAALGLYQYAGSEPWAGCPGRE